MPQPTLQYVYMSKKLNNRNKQRVKKIVRLLSYNLLTLIHSSVKGSRKEVFQPHLPVRLPCYDLAPVTSFALGRPLTVTDFRHPQLPWLDGRCVQGPGTYSPRHG